MRAENNTMERKAESGQESRFTTDRVKKRGNQICINKQKQWGNDANDVDNADVRYDNDVVGYDDDDFSIDEEDDDDNDDDDNDKTMTSTTTTTTTTT